jgi:hypothetical protein
MSLVRRPTPMSPSREPSPHRSGSPIDSPCRRRQKEEKDPHLHTDKNKTRTKLEQLCSTRLVHRDPKVTKLLLISFRNAMYVSQHLLVTSFLTTSNEHR